MFEDDPAKGPDEPDPQGAGEPDVTLEIPATDEDAAAEAYQQRARLAEDRLAEVLTAYREFRHETEGYRDRLSKTLQRKFEHRHEALLLKFIDILDNFDRALDSAQTAGDPLIEGLILVRAQLLQTLQEEGLERIPVIGLPYDPHLSEAMGTLPVEDPEQHHLVVRELLRGYRLNGRIARPSQVLIGAHGDSAEAVALPPRPADALIGIAAPAAEEAAAEPEAGPRADGEPTLDEIIARAEAREAEKAPDPAPTPAILYDDLTALAEPFPGEDDSE